MNRLRSRLINFHGCMADVRDDDFESLVLPAAFVRIASAV